MKTKLTIVVGLLACSFCLPDAFAQDDPAKPKRPARGPSKERIMKRFDKDQDGALSKEEIAAMPERMRANMLKKWDKDESGDLSKEEVDAIKFPERRPGGAKKDGDTPKKKKGGDAPKKKDKDAGDEAGE
jgi:hypothetical protein